MPFLACAMKRQSRRFRAADDGRFAGGARPGISYDMMILMPMPADAILRPLLLLYLL